jgi:hypothetical protein
MFSIVKIAAASAVMGAALAATGFAGGPSPAASPGPLRCEIRIVPAGGMIAVSAVVHADAAATGTYALRLSGGGSGGSSNISQGGPFAVEPGAPVTVGNMVIGAGGRYDAVLEIAADGTKITCAEHIGGSI